MNQELKETSANNETQFSGWHKFSGLFMILLGVMFFIAQSDVKIFGQSPWMFFALIPVFWILANAWRQYVENGREVNGRILALLTWGLFPFIFIAAGIFGFSASTIWPLVLVFIGIGIIFNQNA